MEAVAGNRLLSIQGIPPDTPLQQDCAALSLDIRACIHIQFPHVCVYLCINICVYIYMGVYVHIIVYINIEREYMYTPNKHLDDMLQSPALEPA